MAINNAQELVRKTGNLSVPMHLRNAPTKLMKDIGYSDGYKYAHDFPNHYVEQQYLPYELSGKEFYRPTGNGYEQKIKEHMKRIKKEAKEQTEQTE